MPRLVASALQVVPRPTTSTGIEFPAWAIVASVMGGFLLVLIVAWIVYSWKTGTLAIGGAVGVPRILKIESVS